MSSINPELSLEGIKLEYNFVSNHLRDLVNVRFAYVGTYIIASAANFAKNGPISYPIAIIIISIAIFFIDLRTRIIIRACSRRLNEIERGFFGTIHGYFGRDHKLHAADGRHVPEYGTTPDINEEVFFPWFIKYIFPLSLKSRVDNINPASTFNKWFSTYRLRSESRMLDYTPVIDLLIQAIVIMCACQVIITMTFVDRSLSPDMHTIANHRFSEAK